MDHEPRGRPNDVRVRVARAANRRALDTAAGRTIAYAALVVIAAAVEVYLVRPLDGPAAPDAAASVLYFQRIVAGRHLEAFVNTTPKPLLTLIYGLLFSATHSWQLISLATVAAGAAAAVLGAELARRLGGLAAGAFAFVALAGLQSMLREVSWAYGLPWAVALWFAAALALVRERPRCGVAGFLLLLAALARPETFIVLGIATLAIGAAWLRNRPAARAALPLLGGWLALVAMGVHDWLLIGDPLWWTTVASTHAAATPGQRTSIGGVLRETLDRVRALGLTSVLAVIGTAVLVRRRSWVALVGLVALGPLIVVEDLFFAWRGLDVLGHYLDSIDVVAVLAAAVTVGAAIDLLLARLRTGAPGVVRKAGAAAIVASAVVAALLTPFAPLSSGARAALGRQAELALNEQRVRPTLECAIGANGGAAACAQAPHPERLELFLPSLQLMTVIVDLGIPVTQATTLDVRRLRDEPGYPSPDSLVYFDDDADLTPLEQASAWLRVTSPADVRNVHVVPLLADPAAGLWVVRVDPR